METMSEFEVLPEAYWVENMTKPVLFSQALQKAVQNDHFDLMLEVGPHPALQAPATETQRLVAGTFMPYAGILKRNEDAVEQFENALGFVWMYGGLVASPVNFAGYRAACASKETNFPQVQKGLPPYHWDHKIPMQHESRTSKEWRTRSDPIHELLGSPTWICVQKEVRWRNILKLSELGWLRGHKFQNEVLFPSTGYISMALYAARHLFETQVPIQLLELQELRIHTAVTVEEVAGVDLEFRIRLTHDQSDRKVAEYSCYHRNVGTESPSIERLVFTGKAVAKLGDPSREALPPREAPELPMSSVDVDRFYAWMSQVGLQYSGEFLLGSIKRRMHTSMVTTKRLSDHTFHPVTLDTILQSLFAAHSYPGDGSLWTPYLPANFGRIRVNLAACSFLTRHGCGQLVADTRLAESSASNIRGDIDVFCLGHLHPEIQIQNVVLTPLEVPSISNDKQLFARTVWAKDVACEIQVDRTQSPTDQDHELYEICERTAHFYLTYLCNEVGDGEVPFMDFHFQCLMRWASQYVLPSVDSAGSKLQRALWRTDTLDSIMQLRDAVSAHCIDLAIIHRLGPKLPSIVRGSVPALQLLMEDDMLKRIYQQGLGFPQANAHLGAMLEQLSTQHPRMRIIEIGAGTGGATAVALKSLGCKFEEYAFTDISPGFFDEARATFDEFSSNMQYKVLDIEASPVDQGFEAHSFDLVLASNVLHATASISRALEHCRELLRPGGYLVLLELTSMSLRIPFIFSALPGWWLGHSEGRTERPTITETQWNSVLVDNDFSGVDHAVRDFNDDSIYSYSVMLSQALDDRIRYLRQPLNPPGGLQASTFRIPKLLIISGDTLRISKAAAEIQQCISPIADRIFIIQRLEDTCKIELDSGWSVICLSDLDQPVLKDLTSDRLRSLQKLFKSATFLLWATRNCQAQEPFANMMVGIGRSVAREMSHLQLKFVDFDDLQRQSPLATMMSMMLLQMVFLNSIEHHDILWSNELEVSIRNGDIFNPRVVPDQLKNDRHNATRRRVTQLVSPNAAPITMAETDGNLSLVQSQELTNIECPSHKIELRVVASSLHRFKTTAGSTPFYFCLGEQLDTRKKFLALSEVNGTLIRVPLEYAFEFTCQSSAQTLRGILIKEMCESLLAESTGTIWIHNADSEAIDLLSAAAKVYEVRAFFSDEIREPDSHRIEGVTYFHPHIAERDLRALLPNDITCFIDMGPSNSKSIEDIIPSSLRNDLATKHVLRDVGLKEVICLSLTFSRLCEVLHTHIAKPSFEGLSRVLRDTDIIDASKLHDLSPTSSPFSILNWQDLDNARTILSPITHGMRFSAQRTYFLVGLTGDVGLSICMWMAKHGATHFAVASRSPNVPPEVFTQLRKQGATLRVFSLDVSDMNSLNDIHQDIISSMPPISGVAMGALVLNDKPFDLMSSDDLALVLRPRVLGTQNLDRAFFSTDLEFFILFSSISCIVGNPGQSNYNASNMFMSTLCNQRRARGLAASVIDVGMLIGFGHLHHSQAAGFKFEDHFRREGFLAISESDLHIIFAEAIHAGRPSCKTGCELITGLGSNGDAPWTHTPRLGHYRSRHEAQETGQTSHRRSEAQALSNCLRGVHTDEEALSVLETVVSGKIGQLLGKIAEDLSHDIPLLALGLDSLVAVEIRSWILRELEIDMPVLKILGGASVSVICQDVLGRLPDSLAHWRNTPVTLEGSTSSLPTPSSSSGIGVGTRDLANGVGSDRMDTMLLPCSDEQGRRTADEQDTIHGVTFERVGILCPGQAQLYFLHEFVDDKAFLNVVYHGTFYGQLDVSRLQVALHDVGMCHEAVRSAYFMESATKSAMQAVMPQPRITLNHLDVTEQFGFEDAIMEGKKYVFDIERGSVMKVTILSQSPTQHHMVFSHHHIALDGMGWGVFLDSLASTYKGNKLPSNVQQSIEMAEKKQSDSEQRNLQDDLEYWRTIYHSLPETLPLFRFSKVAARQLVKTYSNVSADVQLDQGRAQNVRSASSKIGVTSFHFYLACLVTFLSRCLRVSDVAIGVVDANRRGIHDSETVGYSLNVLPVRISSSKEDTFEFVARSCRDAVLGALAHSQPALTAILDHLGIVRSNDSHPLFQVAVNYERLTVSETGFGYDGKVQWTGAVPAGVPYDLLVNIHETPKSTFLSFVTQESLYTQSDTELMLGWFTRAIENLCRQPSTEISRCRISNDSDISQVVKLGRGDYSHIPWEGTVIDRINEMAKQYAGDIAIEDDEGQFLTYHEMLERSYLAAQQLKQFSPPPGSFVAVLLEPTADAVCCLLAVLRLGLVWIPLDTRNHQERLRAIALESLPCVIICHPATEEQARQLAAGSSQVMLLEYDREKSALSPDQSPKCSHLSQLDEPMALLYTSGSTGTPKGVLLTHEGLVSQIHGTTVALGLGRETTLQQSPLGFDLMLDQVFLALCNGGKTVVVGKDGRGDPLHIAKLMVSRKVSLTHFVPSEYNSLLNYGHHILKRTSSWLHAMSGGEKMGPELRRAFQKLGSPILRLVNVYGPAEVTIACARGIVPYQSEEDIFSTVDNLLVSPNYSIQILDDDLDLVPVGFPGEICISGPGVGLGYLNRPMESAEKFLYRDLSVPNQASLEQEQRHSRTYRSGDLGRILPGGTLKVLGRLDGDSQVKIRGHRVELDEIANAILRISKGVIVSAAASLRAPSTLAAFIVFDSDYPGDKAEYAETVRLSLPLPLYMRPDSIVCVGRIPATSNGKVDRAAVDRLPVPDDNFHTNDGVKNEQLSTWENSIKEIWDEVLAQRATAPSHDICRDTDFFSVGGNSLLLIKLRSILQSTFSIALSLPELFQTSRLSDMAHCVESHVLKPSHKLMPSGQNGDYQIDWDVEIATISDGLSQYQADRSLNLSKSSSTNNGLIVLVTGATGFIGRHILQQLIDDTRIEAIHCIAIRPTQSGDPRHTGVSSSKVIEYSGDLSDLSLGLGDTDFKHLSEQVDVIIHNGADVSLLKSYHSLRRPNVVSSRVLCELALPRLVPIHFVSTASVAKVIYPEALVEVSASSHLPRLDLIDGYAASKWAAEVLLERASMDYGLPVWVHRLAHVVGNDASELDAVGMLFKYSLILKALPIIDSNKVVGTWDFVMVDDVARNLVKDVVGSVQLKDLPGSEGPDGIKPRFVHHCNDKKIPPEKFKEYLEGLAGEPLHEVDMKQWLQAALRRGMSPLVHDYLAGFGSGEKALVLPVLDRE